MTNTERIAANNEELRESIAMAASLPNAGGGGIFVEDTEYPGCFYREVDGEKEWLNPPMVYGMAYPTVERFNGKRVWIGVIDYGAVSKVYYGRGISFNNLTSPDYEYPEEVFMFNYSIIYAYPYFSDDWYYHPYQHPSDPDWGGLITDEGSHMQINFDYGYYNGTTFDSYNFRCLFKFTEQ